MERLLVRDEDLYSYWMRPELGETVRWLGDTLHATLDPDYAQAAFWIRESAGDDPAGMSADDVVESLFRLCPDNLAERLHGALNLYRAVGQRACPRLLPLAYRLLQAELLLYTRLKKTGKPYRDHLGHQTRVAALAHMLVKDWQVLKDGPVTQWPEELQTDTILDRWHNTLEFHLLRQFALRRRLVLPDPARDKDTWKGILGAATLLAGLVHDIGYIQKALGDVADPVSATFESIRFLPAIEDLKGLHDTPLEAFYRQIVEHSGPCQTFERIETYVAAQYREIHSLVGAVWLAQYAWESGRKYGLLRPKEDDEERHVAYSHVLLTFHMASLLAFAHDLALTDDERRGRLGLRKGPGDQDMLHFTQFPFCTLFALADVLQEFGRLLRVKEGDTVRFIAPIGCLGFRSPDLPSDAERVRQFFFRRLWNSKKLKEHPLLLSFGTRDGKHTHLPGPVIELRGKSEWEEDRVGEKLSAWLRNAGLGDFIALDGQPGALAWINKRYKHLRKLEEELSSMSGRAGNAELTAVRAELSALARFLGIRPSYLGEAVKDMVENNNSKRRMMVLPVFDMGEGDRFIFE